MTSSDPYTAPATTRPTSWQPPAAPSPDRRPQSYNPAPAPAPKKKSYRAAKIIGGAIGVIVLISAIAGIAGGRKTKTVNVSRNPSPSTAPSAAPTTATPTTAAPTATVPKTPATSAAPQHSPATSPPVAPTTAPTPPAPKLPSQTFSGTSDEATPPFTVTSGLAVFKATYKGTDNFAVELIDSNGQSKDVLFNQIGSYSGSSGDHLDAGSYVLKVTATGPWTITVDQPRPSTGDALPKSYTGTSEAIIGPFRASTGSTRMQFHFTGSANFAVEVFDNTGTSIDVAANQIGNYNGSTVEQTDPGSLYWLKVNGDGSWTIDIS